MHTSGAARPWPPETPVLRRCQGQPLFPQTCSRNQTVWRPGPRGINPTPASGLVSLVEQTLRQGQGSPLRLSRLLAAGGLRLPRGVLPTTSQLAVPGTPRQGQWELSRSASVSGPEVTRFGGTWKDQAGQNGCLFTKRSCQEAGAQASLLRTAVRRSNGRDIQKG